MKLILMDIEGTTSSISFVHQELFPYAKKRLPLFLKEKIQELKVQEALKEVEKIEGKSLTLDQATEVLQSWIDQDKKLSPLKALQGLIWEEGYESGEIQGHVYPEVAKSFERWTAQGLQLGIYSSGSVLAQKLIFGFSLAGNLCPYLLYYFDTQVGPKRVESSYDTIAQKVGLVPGDILFLSDTPEELAAAKAAGMQVTELRRDGAVPAGPYPWVTDFTQIQLG